MSPPSFANGSIYLKGRSLSNVNTLYGLDAATGTVLASAGGAAISNFNLVALEQALSVGGGVLLVWNLATGASGLTSYANQVCNSRPAVANGRFFYTDRSSQRGLLSARGP